MKTKKERKVRALAVIREHLLRSWSPFGYYTGHAAIFEEKRHAVAAINYSKEVMGKANKKRHEGLKLVECTITFSLPPIGKGKKKTP